MDYGLFFYPTAVHDVSSSLILQVGLGQLSGALLMVVLFSQSGNFINFLNYKPGTSFSSHILKSFKVLEKHSCGTQDPWICNLRKIFFFFFSCSFVRKSDHNKKG